METFAMVVRERIFDPDGHEPIPEEPELDLAIMGFDVVEEGVRKLVKALWDHGCKTVCSCAGHLDDLEPYPWVVIPVNLADETRQAAKLLEAVGRFNMMLGKDGKLPKALDT